MQKWKQGATTYYVEQVQARTLTMGDQVLDDDRLERCTYLGKVTQAHTRTIGVFWEKWEDTGFPGMLSSHQYVWKVTYPDLED